MALRTPLVLAVAAAAPHFAAADTFKRSPTSGATATGVDANGTWDLANPYWYNQTTSAGGLAWVNGNLASFGGGTVGTYTVTLGSTITAGGIAFTNSAYTIPGGTGPFALTLGGGGVDVAGAVVATSATSPQGVPTAAIAGYATINAALAGASELTKTGNGFLQLGANSAGSSGCTTINGGGLIIASATNLTAGTVTVGTGTVSSSNVGFLSVTGTGDISLGNAFALPPTASTTDYTLGKSGTGSLLTLGGALSGGNSTTWLMFNTPTSGDGLTRLVLNGNNSGYAGNIRVNRGSGRLATRTPSAPGSESCRPTRISRPWPLPRPSGPGEPEPLSFSGSFPNRPHVARRLPKTVQ